MHLSYLVFMKKNNMFLTPTTPDDIEVLISNIKVTLKELVQVAFQLKF